MRKVLLWLWCILVVRLDLDLDLCLFTFQQIHLSISKAIHEGAIEGYLWLSERLLPSPSEFLQANLDQAGSVRHLSQCHFERRISFDRQTDDTWHRRYLDRRFLQQNAFFVCHPAGAHACLALEVSFLDIRHAAFLLTFLTHFVLVFAARGIMVSTTAIALSFWLKMWRLSFFFDLVDIVVTTGRAGRLPANVD